MYQKKGRRFSSDCAHQHGIKHVTMESNETKAKIDPLEMIGNEIANKILYIKKEIRERNN